MLKKIVAVILTIALFLGGLVPVQSAHAREADIEENMQSVPEKETSIEAENSFGSLFPQAMRKIAMP